MGAEHIDALAELGLLHALRAAEDYRPGVLDLVAPEFAEVLHIHPRAGGVHDGGEAAGHELRVADVLHGAYDVRELAHAAGLYEYAVGPELLLHLLEGLREIAHQRAADAAGAHLGYLDARLGQEAAVDGNLAELVLDKDELLAPVGLVYELLYERGLARAQEAGENIYLSHTLRFLCVVIE